MEERALSSSAGASLKGVDHWAGRQATFFSNVPSPVGPYYDSTPPQAFHRRSAQEKAAKFFDVVAAVHNFENSRSALATPFSWRQLVSALRGKFMATSEQMICTESMLELEDGEDGISRFSGSLKPSVSYRVDPYQAWWNGKVSLFGFLRWHVCRRMGDVGAPVSENAETSASVKSVHEAIVEDGNTDFVEEPIVVGMPQGLDFDKTPTPAPVEFDAAISEQSHFFPDFMSLKMMDGKVSVQLRLESGFFVVLVVCFLGHYLYLLREACRKRRADRESKYRKMHNLDTVYTPEDSWEDEITEADFVGPIHHEVEDRRRAAPPSVAAASMMSALSLLEGDSSSDDEADTDICQQLSGLGPCPSNRAADAVQNSLDLSLDSIGPLLPCSSTSTTECENDNVAGSHQCGVHEALATQFISKSLPDDESLYICFSTEISSVTNFRSPARETKRISTRDVDDAHKKWITKMKSRCVIHFSGQSLDEAVELVSPPGLIDSIGKVKLVDESEKGRGGVFIVSASSVEEAHAIASNDPYHEEDLCRFRVLPWVVDQNLCDKTLDSADGVE